MVTNSIKKQKRLKWSTLKKTKSLKKQATMTYLFTLHFLSQSKHGRLPVESCRPALLPCQRPLQVTHVLSNPAKTVTWICSREGKKNPNFQGPAFLLKVLFEGKFVFSFTFYILFTSLSPMVLQKKHPFKTTWFSQSKDSMGRVRSKCLNTQPQLSEYGKKMRVNEI